MISSYWTVFNWPVAVTCMKNTAKTMAAISVLVQQSQLCNIKTTTRKKNDFSAD